MPANALAHIPAPRQITVEEFRVAVVRREAARIASAGAFDKALAAFEDHARRFVAARLDTMRQLGITEPPARDRRPA